MTDNCHLPVNRIAKIANVAAYKFVPIDDADRLRQDLLDMCLLLALKGTILRAPEGINLFLAGSKEAIDAFLAKLIRDKRFATLEAKWSWSHTVPFERLRVKLKKEIVTLRCAGIDPVVAPAPLVAPAELRRWYDEGRDFAILDTRNEWEYAAGTFANAINPHLRSFSEFPRAIDKLPHLRDQTIVTFCTGGIRCEKAAPYCSCGGSATFISCKGAYSSTSRNAVEHIGRGIARYLTIEARLTHSSGRPVSEQSSRTSPHRSRPAIVIRFRRQGV